MTWPRFSTAALGVFTMIAGCFLRGIDANGAGMLVASGTALVAFATPWPEKRNRDGTPSDRPRSGN